MRWDEFNAACPDLATLARERFERDEVVMLGTIRADGRPRLSPCAVDFAADRVLFGMMWRSPKARDLLRDPRLTVHSVPSDKTNAGGDLKLYGAAVDEQEPDIRAQFCQAIRARIDWQPTEPYHLFSLDVTEAAFVRFTDDCQHIWRWNPSAGLRREQKPTSEARPPVVPSPRTGLATGGPICEAVTGHEPGLGDVTRRGATSSRGHENRDNWRDRDTGQPGRRGADRTRP